MWHSRRSSWTIETPRPAIFCFLHSESWSWTATIEGEGFCVGQVLTEGCKRTGISKKEHIYLVMKILSQCSNRDPWDSSRFVSSVVWIVWFQKSQDTQLLMPPASRCKNMPLCIKLFLGGCLSNFQWISKTHYLPPKTFARNLPVVDLERRVKPM